MSLNPRVGIYYTIGAMVLAVAAWFAKPWGYLLLSPATSATLVATGYFGLGQKVSLHCKIGYSRTAPIAGSYLVHSGHATDANEAIRQLKQARPSIIIRREANWI